MKKNIIIFLSIIFTACSNKPEKGESDELGIFEISKVQFNSEKMELGEPMLHPFAEVVNFTGKIVPAIDGKALINLTIPGLINKIHIKQGDYIKKGATLFEISGNSFIELQKDFAESSVIYSKLKGEYLRAKELFSDNILSTKDFTTIESNFLSENAKYMSLKIKLENLGLDVAKIEKGIFYSNYFVKSPINGFVSNINATLGQYIDPQQNIAEIINDKSFQLRISIFEKDINKIQIGQHLIFYLNGDKNKFFRATINSVGKNIVEESKSMECYATIANTDSLKLVNNQFVEGEVSIATDSVKSVPESAIIFSDKNSYLLLYEKEDDSKFYFKKIKVITGRKAGGFVELKQQLPSKKMLIDGIYNIQIE